MAKLVTLGDSLTQGFQSLAITRTDHAYPSMIAQAMGLAPSEFAYPDFAGCGGLPCSIEWLARRLESTHGSTITGLEWLGAMRTIAGYIDEVEAYWERGPGIQPSPDALFHNLAVWGFEVGDASKITAALCAEAIRGSKDNWFKPPSEPRLRTALRVLNPALNPARATDTQLSIANKIRDRDGGIEHLIAWYGANNCLRTVLQLEILETGDTPPAINSAFTLWSPRAFETEYVALAGELAMLGAKHTYVATVPHVTIPPVTRGHMANGGPLPAGRTYYDYYSYFFLRDADFDPRTQKHLTAADAAHIDATVDAYNAVITREATKRGWHVVDICAMLDGLAVRRNHGTPGYPLPQAFADRNLSTGMLQISDGKLVSGGLISLDGIHPTACGYALVAQAFIEQMRPHEPTIRDIDFAAIARLDPLVSDPPRTLDDMVGVLRTLEQCFTLTRWMGGAVSANL